MDDYATEDIRVDPKIMDQAFRRGLKVAKIAYLEELKQMAIDDYELEGEKTNIKLAFESLRKFIKSKPNSLNSLSVRHLEDFGLSKDVVERIGYLAIQYESVSPIERQKNRSRIPSMAFSEDYYDDDFEDDEIESVEDEEESVSTLHNNFLSPVNRAEHKKGKIPTVEEFKDKEDCDFYEDDEIADETFQIVKNAIYPEPSMDKTPTRAKNTNNKYRPYSTNNAKDDDDDDEKSVEQAKRAKTVGSLNIAPKKKIKKTAAWVTNGDWHIGDLIGTGSFGEVYKVMNPMGKFYAAKKMNITEKSSEVESLLSEIQLMRGLSHKHIVGYIGARVDPNSPVLFIIQEWVPNGSVAHLLKKFGPFGEGVVRNYTTQILYGLSYLHANGIIHRDIKGGNILVDDDGIVKLADFGASTRLSAFDKTQETSTIKGTPYFMAPEVLAQSRYGRKGDIWAVGCTMIQMLTGEPPWKDHNLKGLIQLHILLTSWEKGPPNYDCPFSAEGRECLNMCFRKDESERPTAQDLLKCKFLQPKDDELDESAGSTKQPNGSSYDVLEDSGVMRGLKQDMAKAVSRSSLAGINGGLRGEDTLAIIDQQIHERQRQSQSRQAQSRQSTANPYGSSPRVVSARKNNHTGSRSSSQDTNDMSGSVRRRRGSGSKLEEIPGIQTDFDNHSGHGGHHHHGSHGPSNYHSENPYQKGRSGSTESNGYHIPISKTPLANSSGAPKISSARRSYSNPVTPIEKFPYGQDEGGTRLPPALSNAEVQAVANSAAAAIASGGGNPYAKGANTSVARIRDSVSAANSATNTPRIGHVYHNPSYGKAAASPRYGQGEEEPPTPTKYRREIAPSERFSEQDEVRESLQHLKKRTTSFKRAQSATPDSQNQSSRAKVYSRGGPRYTGSRPVSTASSVSNQSSNRDSEGLTPLPVDSDNSDCDSDGNNSLRSQGTHTSTRRHHRALDAVAEHGPYKQTKTKKHIRMDSASSSNSNVRPMSNTSTSSKGPRTASMTSGNERVASASVMRKSASAATVEHPPPIERRKTHTGHGHRSKSSESLNPLSILPAEAEETASAPTPRRDFWVCLKCEMENTHPRFCENCATMRGADGKRGNGAALHRANG